MRTLIVATALALAACDGPPPESHLPGLRIVERAFLRWIPLLRRRIAVLAVKPPSGGVR